MKKLVVAKKDACMACKACEIACSEAFYKTFDERKSCITISMKKDGTPKPMVCPQCGKCAEALPHYRRGYHKAPERLQEYLQTAYPPCTHRIRLLHSFLRKAE